LRTEALACAEETSCALDLELIDDETTALEEPYVLRQPTWF
jgi:hypothetical protein